MRLAILSDIHGNRAALEAVIEDIARRRVDRVWVGGDLVGRGPEGNAVVHRLRGLGWPTIGGNHEDYLLDFHHRRTPAEWEGREEWNAARWMAAELDAEAIRHIEQLPFSLEDQGLKLVHGTPESNRHGIGPWTRESELADHLAKIAENILVCCHTHRPLDRTVDGGRVVNTGSVGLPFNRDQRAQYALFTLGPDGWQAEAIQVDYDLEATSRAYQTTGFLAAGGVTARLLLLELEHATPILVPFIEWARHTRRHPDTTALDAFFQVFDPHASLRDFMSGVMASR